MIIGSIFEATAIESIFTKNLNKQTRGMLCGFYSFMGNLGFLLFSIAGGWLFDKIGP